MSSYGCRSMLTVAMLLMALPLVLADQVCNTAPDGKTICENKLATGTVVAITMLIVALIALIGGGIGFLLYRRRQFAAAKAAVAANAYVIEASQMRGPAVYTTYSASYDPKSAPQGVAGLPTKPGSAKKTPQTAPTSYGGVTYPFPGFSPKSTPPRSSQAAFSGTYTTMNSMGKSVV
ncbi:hypothetical protein C8J57DRAFT_285069 [Mycena rebaudengoi]|nr:hypothetical protein C8J57DRAFT_1720053 [Mycena rebaudengoi]KAJ7271462.1 hypothetical protein C8J57DRAFT_285069 [Mycena rebaudengoi]